MSPTVHQILEAQPKSVERELSIRSRYWTVLRPFQMQGAARSENYRVEWQATSTLDATRLAAKFCNAAVPSGAH